MKRTKTNKRICSLGIIALLFVSMNLHSQQTEIQLDSTLINISILIGNLYVPWEITYGPDGNIWMTERNGIISKVNPNSGERTVLITLDDCAEIQESGLLGLCLHPDFAENPYVYFVYTYFNQAEELKEKLVRYTYKASTQTLEEEFVMIDNIRGFKTHNGSRVFISPDLKIIMTTGDAQDVSTSQDLENLNGKTLRLNLDGSIPSDNPFPDSPIYSYGHRNPQGLALTNNGFLFSSEHGPNSDDEINIIERSNNYGWPNVEGYCDDVLEMNFCDSIQVTYPRVIWTPTIAPGGIEFYNHPSIPEWQNSIILAVLKQKDFRVMELNDAGTSILSGEASQILKDDYGRFRDVCVMPDGKIILATSNNDGYGDESYGPDKLLLLESTKEVANFPIPKFIYEYDSDSEEYAFKNLSQNANSYEWDFGDGSFSTEINPTKKYQEAGEFEIKLTAFNGDLSNYQKYKIGLNPNPPHIAPKAAFGNEVQCLSVTFTNQSSNADDVIWDFGDEKESTEENPVHTYDQNGSYLVSLIANNVDTESNSFSDTTTLEINVEDCIDAIENINTIPNINIFPNPSTDCFYIELPKNFTPIGFEIRNSDGKLVKKEIFEESNTTKFYRNCENLATGLYFIHIYNELGTSLSSKIVLK